MNWDRISSKLHWTDIFISILLSFFRIWHPDLPATTIKDCISICDEETKIEVDPSYPLLLNVWLQDELEKFFRFILKWIHQIKCSTHLLYHFVNLVQQLSEFSRLLHQFDKMVKHVSAAINLIHQFQNLEQMQRRNRIGPGLSRDWEKPKCEALCSQNGLFVSGY